MEGYTAFASANNHDFTFKPSDSGLEVFSTEDPANFSIDEKDWPIYKANNNRSASVPVEVSRSVIQKWEYKPANDYLPTAAISADEYVFVAGKDGAIRCLNENDGSVKWISFTEGQIKVAPTLWEGYLFVGSSDGYIYAFEALTGKLIWRFNTTPAERYIRNHADIVSTWSVNTGIIVDKGVLYAASGIVGWNGMFVCAINAKTGKLKWVNLDSSFYLDPNNHVGASPHGIMVIAKGKLWFCGGSRRTSIVGYDLETGTFTPPVTIMKSSHGMDMGSFRGNLFVSGTRLHAPVNARRFGKDLSFTITRIDQDGNMILPTISLPTSTASPAWDDKSIIYESYRRSKFASIGMYDVSAIEKEILATTVVEKPSNNKPFVINKTPTINPTPLWKATGTVYGLALAENVVITIACNETVTSKSALADKWTLKIYSRSDGKETSSIELQSEPLMGAMCITRNGSIVIPCINGKIVTFK